MDAELRALVQATEAVTRPARRGLRLVAAGTTAAGVIALGGAAAAAGFLPPEWMPSSTTAGRACETSYSVRLAGPGDGQPMTREVAAMTTAEKQHVVEAANAFLATFDYDSIDVEAVIDEWQVSEARIRAEAEPGERQPRINGADLELTAVGGEVVQRLEADLSARGLNMDAVVFVAGHRCQK